MANLVLRGADIFLILNGKAFNSVQSISYTLDSGESEIYGVDSYYPQEIAPVRSVVAGTISGIRIRNSGGLTALGLRPLAVSPLSGAYGSLRIRDRVTGEDILFVPQARFFNEQNQVSAKGIWKLNFSFKGVVAFQASDRGSGS